MLREAACLQVAKWLFQRFAPLKEKDFLPFSVPVLGKLRPVDALRSLYEVLCEFFLNKLCNYGGASTFKRLISVNLHTPATNSSIGNGDTRFFYKNNLYKKHQAEIRPKIRTTYDKKAG